MKVKLKDEFKKLPVPLKKQIINRVAAGGLFLLLFAVISAVAHDFILSLPCLLAAGYFMINGGVMLVHCVSGQYVTIRGTCTEIEKSVLRKRVKALYISSEKGAWKIPAQRKAKGIAAGTEITVYMSDKTRVYEQNGIFIASGCYAYESRNERRV
jgi:hypothetical protein